MSDVDYYELQEEVHKLREEFAKLKFQQRINPIKSNLIRLTNMQEEFANGVHELKELVQDFNKNKMDIEQKLQNTNYLHIDRNSALHFKSITQQAFDILAKPVVDNTNPEETAKTDIKIEQNFISKVSQNLRKREDFHKCTSRLLTGIGKLCDNENLNTDSLDSNGNTDIFEYEYKISTNADCTINSTINSIMSDYVTASSPILLRSVLSK